MAGLIDTIRGAIAPSTIENLASRLGESPANTGNALTGIIPVILAALAGRVQSGGAGGVVDMIKSALSAGNPLDRQGALANPPAAGVAPDDGGLSSGLFGGSLGNIAGTLAEKFGIKAESVKTLLGVGSLLGAGGIANALNGNVTPQGLTDLFRREGPGITAALPAGLGSLLGGFGSSATGTAGRVVDEVSDTAGAAAGGIGRWLPWLLLAALLAAALIFGLRACSDKTATTTPTTTADTTVPAPDVTTPAVTTPTIPTGSGVVAEQREGKPALVVYFDVGKSEVSRDLSTASAEVKKYLEANPGTTLAVAGFNDPTGNAAANAELSKNRAEEVRKALAATGIPAASINLEKPAETTGTGDTNAQSRRVEVTVREAGAAAN